MNKIYFGVEKYCTCTYYGEVKKYDWFCNNKNIPILNGFSFDHMIYDYEEIYNIENEANYYEIKYDNKVRYFKKLNMNTYIINNYSLKSSYLSVDFLVLKNINFYYIIDCGDYLTINNIILTDKILKLVKEKKCKILLNTSYEPYSNENFNLVNILDHFYNKYKFNENELLILTGNLNVINKENKKYKFISYCYFLEHPWFIEKDCNFTESSNLRINDINKKAINDKNNFIKINNNINNFEKKILCYNRRAHPHRKYLFYSFYNDELIYNNSFISLNNSDKSKYNNYIYYFGVSKDESNRINEFFYNSPQYWIFDDKNLNINLANNFDDNFHKKTFVSVVSETNVLNDVVFFSEKTFKPIYACQPFIISGNPFSLKKLKEFGFKTFDKWWDESYDDEVIFINRIEKIKNILHDLLTKSDDELIYMLRDMTDVLSYNFDVFMSYTNKSLINVLSKNIENKETILI